MTISPPPRGGWWMPVLAILFIGSGCAALIYEIAWLQLLQLVLGSSAVSLAVLLATFMGGLCLGSLGFSRIVPQRWNPLRVYAAIETGIALLALVVLWVTPWVGRLYVSGAGHGMPAVLLRGIAAAVCLLPPTLLMGATFPAISRWIIAFPQGLSRLGWFYSANIVGAVFGALIAGFYLLRVYDMATATYVAAALNLAVAAVSCAISFSESVPLQPATPSAETKPAGRGTQLPYWVAGLSGLCALGAEVVWTRLLSLMIGPTVYTFSIILACYLAGLGVGSALGSALVRRGRKLEIVLGVCQAMSALAIAWAAWQLARALPYWPVAPGLSSGLFLSLQVDITRCLWAVFPATLCWGATFPLALAAAETSESDPAKLSGRVYAANTVGAIVGAAGFALVIIPWLGTQGAHQVLICLSGVSALVMFAAAFLSSTDRRGWITPVLAAFAAVVVVMIGTVPNVPWQLIAYGRFMAAKLGEGRPLYRGEGINASVAVTELEGGVRNFHVSGKVEASTEPQDMRMQCMLGHLPALIHPNPQSVLVVGCGAGVTAGSFVLYPGVKRIVICEIEPLIPKAIAPWFKKENHAMLDDPRVEVIYDDARHYILTTKERFDIITSDPIHPWVKGAATLYTTEYFDHVRRHLNPGGLVTQWVPLYESSFEVVKSEMATFFAAFPDGTVWGNTREGEGYDVVLLGGEQSTLVNLDAFQERFRRNEAAAAALHNVGIRSHFGLLGDYAGRARELEPWLRNAQINRDRNLRLQYLAGLGLNHNESQAIYGELLGYRRFPEGIFPGSDSHRDMLRLLLEKNK